MGAAVDTNGETYVVASGERLRGDHPAVQVLGERIFVLDSTPANEMPDRYEGIVTAEEIEQAGRPITPPRIDPATPLKDLVLCTRGVEWSIAGTAEQGWIFAASDAVVLAAPEAFAPLAEHLGSAGGCTAPT